MILALKERNQNTSRNIKNSDYILEQDNRYIMILSCIVAYSHGKIEIEIYFVMLSRKKWCVTHSRGWDAATHSVSAAQSSAVQTRTRSEH